MYCVFIILSVGLSNDSKCKKYTFWCIYCFDKNRGSVISAHTPSEAFLSLSLSLSLSPSLSLFLSLSRFVLWSTIIVWETRVLWGTFDTVFEEVCLNIRNIDIYITRGCIVLSAHTLSLSLVWKTLPVKLHWFTFRSVLHEKSRTIVLWDTIQ